MGLEGGDQVGGGEQEYPGVPQVLAARQHQGGGGGVGLFDKAVQGLREGGEIPGRGGQFQPAIADLGPVGTDAEGDQLASKGAGHGGLHGVAKLGVVGDDMVGGGDQHQGTGVGGVKRQGGGEDGGGGVAALGLDDHGGGVQGDVRQLFGHDEAKIRGGHHQRRTEPLGGKAPGRGLKQAFSAGQGRELLGKAFARQGPQPGARAAAQQDGVDDLGHFRPALWRWATCVLIHA